MGRKTNQNQDADGVDSGTPPQLPDSDVLDLLGAHVAVLDERGCIVAVNEAWRRFSVDIGGDESKLGIGANYLEVCQRILNSNQDEVLQATLRGIRAVLDGTQPSLFLEYSCPAPTGKQWFAMKVLPFSGNRKGAVIEHENVTARRQAEQEIRRLNAELEQRVQERTNELAANEVRHRLLEETMLQGVVHQDATGKIIAMNPAAEKILGKTREQFIGSSSVPEEPDPLREIGKLFSGAEHPAMVALRTGQPVRGVVMGVFNPKLGDYRWLNIDAMPIFAPGETRAAQVYTIFQDITERKAAEQSIQRLNESLTQRATELQAANQALEAFCYSVSHDLRAPLRSIDGFSRILLEDYSNKLDDQGRDNLQRVRAASQRMGQLIDDLLNLSRYSRSELQCRPVNLSVLAHTVVEELQKQAPERQAEIVIAPDLLVSADTELMRVVLVNLLENAWKFTSKKAAAKIEFGRTPAAGLPVFFVRDNGAGFDMTYADKLFGAFQRLHSVTDFPGTGIGLATVRRIIHRHGGRVWAESQVNQGATFYFTLPAMNPAGQTRPATNGENENENQKPNIVAGASAGASGQT